MRKLCEVCHDEPAINHHEGYGFLCQYCTEGLSVHHPIHVEYMSLEGHTYDLVY